MGWRIVMETPVQAAPPGLPKGEVEEARLLCRSCNVKPQLLLSGAVG